MRSGRTGTIPAAGRILALALLVLLALPARPLVAQDEPPEDEREPWDIEDRDELREQGWQFREGNLATGSAGGGALALTVGFLVHGIGHLYIGDNRSALQLLAAEGISIVTLVAAGLLRSNTTSDAQHEVANGLQTFGWSLFVSSWLADVIGTFKGRSIPLPPNTAEAGGLAAEIHYSALPGSTLGFGGIFSGRLPLEVGRFLLTPETQLSLDFGYRLFGVTAGFEIPVTERHTAFSFEGSILDESYNYSNVGSGRNQIGLMARFAFDLGELMEHLDGMVWRNGVGVTADFFYFDSDQNRRFQFDQLAWQVPFDTELSFNLSRALNLSLGLAHRNDHLVGAASNGAYTYEEISFSPRNRLGFEVRAEQGRFNRLWVGFRYVLAGARAE